MSHQLEASTSTTTATRTPAATTVVARFSTEQLDEFSALRSEEQTNFVLALVHRLKHHQLTQIYSIMEPMLKRDFITQLPPELALKIFSYCDHQTLCRGELVCHGWRRVLLSDRQWREVYCRRYSKQLIPARIKDPRTWKQRFVDMFLRHKAAEENWRHGNAISSRIVRCNSLGIYCMQYNDNILVSGHRDNNIRIWDINDGHPIHHPEILDAVPETPHRKMLVGHEGSVLSLQFSDTIVISGSSDNTIKIWDLETGECLQTLVGHTQAVLHVGFDDRIIVSCSKDYSIRVWTRTRNGRSAVEAMRLAEHRAAVNAVEFCGNILASASGDRTIRIWDLTTGSCERVLTGHTRGIACLHLLGDLVVSGSSDRLIKLWNIHTGVCLRTLEGHQDLVRCIRMSADYIVSGSYDRTIRIWNTKTGDAIKVIGDVHTHRILRIQFDEFKIVSSSQDDSIVIWDFTHGALTHKNFLTHTVSDARADDGVDDREVASSDHITTTTV